MDLQVWILFRTDIFRYYSPLIQQKRQPLIAFPLSDQGLSFTLDACHSNRSECAGDHGHYGKEQRPYGSNIFALIFLIASFHQYRELLHIKGQKLLIRRKRTVLVFYKCAGAVCSASGSASVCGIGAILKSSYSSAYFANAVRCSSGISRRSSLFAVVISIASPLAVKCDLHVVCFILRLLPVNPFRRGYQIRCRYPPTMLCFG